LEEVQLSRKQQRDDAVQERLQRPRRAPAACTWDKGHGRLEYRELWVVPAADLGPYLATEWGWQDITQIGWIRRYRKRTRDAHWTVEEHTFVTSAADLAPAGLLYHLRAHWTIENRVHYPRDVSWQEDRYHGRAIGPMLAWLRNLALTLIRQQRFAFVPDAWSYLAAHAEEARLWLVGKLKS
jgi:predicted transposase YbfD/YdcC